METRPDREMIPAWILAAAALKGSDRRQFMARTVQAWGRGGQRWALENLGWCRDTIRKGLLELEAGMDRVDAATTPHRRQIPERLPGLLEDIRQIVDGGGPGSVRSGSPVSRQRLSAAEIRRRLISDLGYTDEQLPSQQTINAKLHRLGLKNHREIGP